MDTKLLPAVLIVEDEPLIRLDAVFTIQDAGFRTYEANSADAALKILQDRDDIGIVFTDVDMPGSMDGIKLAERIRTQWPDLAVVITSGIYGLDKMKLPEGVLSLPKPYATSHLIRKLHACAG
jgi:CheY-like chemotaxis protein